MGVACFFEKPVAVVHLQDQTLQPIHGCLLLVDDPPFEVRQRIKGKIINALFRIDQHDPCVARVVGRRDPENDRLHQNRLARARAAGDQGVRRVPLAGRQEEEFVVIFAYADENALRACWRDCRIPALPQALDVNDLPLSARNIDRDRPGSGRTEMMSSLCVVRSSERRFNTCSTVILALPLKRKIAAFGVSF